MNTIYHQAITLLERLIATPSFSGKEKKTADHIEQFLAENQVHFIRKNNNIWAHNKFFDPAKPIVLLTSHHDNLQLNPQYTPDPFLSLLKDAKFYELDSSYSAGQMVSSITTFLNFYERTDLPFNLCLAASTEQKDSIKQGINGIPIELLTTPMSIREKELMVLECVSSGRSGHADGVASDNAIYSAIKDINWLSTYQFPIEDGQPVPVKITVTQIKAELQQNTVPAQCTFTVVIRFDHSYTQKEILNTISNHTFCEVTVHHEVKAHPSPIRILSY